MSLESPGCRWATRLLPSPTRPHLYRASPFSAMEWLSPAQSGLPKHLHHDADEVFYILEGAVAITAGDDFSVVATPGDFVFLRLLVGGLLQLLPGGYPGDGAGAASNATALSETSRCSVVAGVPRLR